MSWDIPLIELRLSDEDIAAYVDCLRSGWLTMGPATAAFEAALLEWAECQDVVAVSSGSAGLQLAMRALEVGPGDEVIVPAMTFVASASAVRHVGADAVLCDSGGPCAPEMDVADAVARMTDRTKAVVVVHFMGAPTPLQALLTVCRERGIAVIEDASQSMGAISDVEGRPVGTVGDVGVFSFNAKAQLPIGEGGAVACNDPALAARVRSLRSHGMTTGTWDRHRGHHAGYDVIEVGYNYRLDEPRAALGLSRLEQLPRVVEERRAIARQYHAAIGDLPGVEMLGAEAEVSRQSPYGFAIVLADRAKRDRLRAVLSEDGVETTAYPPLTSLTLFRSTDTGLRHAEAFGARHCILPLYPSLREAGVHRVVASVRRAVGR